MKAEHLTETAMHTTTTGSGERPESRLYSLLRMTSRSGEVSPLRTMLLLIVATACLASRVAAAAAANPRVIVTTDINIGRGDPDDRQSLCHLLWYANELDIRAIIPSFNENSRQACDIAFDRYERDFNRPGTKFKAMGYPQPDYFRKEALVATEKAAIQRIIDEAKRDDDRPLWILVWGSMDVVADTLRGAPEIADKLRVITIGTFRRSKEDGGDGRMRNWNDGSPRGRQYVFDTFPKLWWIESDWTYNGMFKGQEPERLRADLARFGGELGRHISEVMATPTSAGYFRAGDTPTVLYVIDPNHDREDPTVASWAGRYTKPFPKERPNFWTGISGGHEWNYADPAKTWHNATKVHQARVQTLLEQRPAMYAALLGKVKALYGTPAGDVEEHGPRPKP